MHGWEQGAIMGDNAFASRLQSPQTIFARGQFRSQTAPFPCGENLLDQDMARDMRAAHTEFAFADRAYCRNGAEADLHILRKLAVIGDVAGRAMRPARQPVEGGAARLGAAASGAEQVPGEVQQPEPGRFQAEFGYVAQRYPPQGCQLARAQPGKIDFLRRRNVAGQTFGQAVTVWAVGNLLRQAGQPLALLG